MPSHRSGSGIQAVTVLAKTDKAMDESTSNGERQSRSMGFSAGEKAFMKKKLDDNTKPVVILLYFNNNPDNLAQINSLADRGYFLVIIGDHNYKGDVVTESYVGGVVPDSVEPRVKELSTNCGFTMWYRFSEQTKYSMFCDIKNIKHVIMDYCNMPHGYMDSLQLYSFRLIDYFRMNKALNAEFQAFIPNNGSKLNKNIKPIVSNGFSVDIIDWKSICKIFYASKKAYKTMKCNGLVLDKEYYLLTITADPNAAVVSACVSYCEDE